jgi:putative colanic acid biosynthesis acetyltransferase WcaF
MSASVDLSSFDIARDSDYRIGRSLLVRTAWYLFGMPLLRCPILPSSSFRRGLLRVFGAEIGDGVVIKPGVRVKFPWKLKVGEHCWIGEDCWIDNLAPVTFGKHVCVSQAAYFCTGNHDWSDTAFRLITGSIVIRDGAWVAARASIGPGVVVGEHAVVGFGAVVTGPVPAYEIHCGNPATFFRKREIAGPAGLRGVRGTVCSR